VKNLKGTARGLRGLWFANAVKVTTEDVIEVRITRAEGANVWVVLTDARLQKIDRGCKLVLDRGQVEAAPVAVTVRHRDGFVEFDAVAAMTEDLGAALEAFGGDS
jgi:hypothetical protein